MYNMHPVAKSVDEIQCSHFSMDQKQIKDLFLPLLLRTTDTTCIRQTVDKIRYHDTDCSTSKDKSVTIRANCSGVCAGTSYVADRLRTSRLIEVCNTWVVIP
jgi:hypothetical protein